MKKLLLLSTLFTLSFSFGQTFEIADGQSMCMIGKGNGQDATINPYADEEYSYVIIENIGAVEFQVRIESIENEIKQFLIKSNDEVVLKLQRNNVLYLDAITSKKAKAKIKYEINESELPLLSSPIKKDKI